LCLWVFKAITNTKAVIRDQWLVLFFMLMRLYAGSALIIAYARTQAPRLPGWALQLAILVFALASPTPYFLARPLIYEAAIAAGQAFVFCGLLAAYHGLIEPRKRTQRFVVAGCCFAAALGSRGSLIIVSPLLIAVTVLAAHRSAGYPKREVLRSLIAMGAPVAAALVMYLIYNKVRFDSFGEFGLKYQLTNPPFMSKKRFILPNIVSYLTSDVSFSCEFPFARLPTERKLTRLILWPGDYDAGDWERGERTAGLLIATSICWLWLVWMWRGARNGLRAYVRPAPITLSTRELWLLGCAFSLMLALAPATRMWMANTRFVEDALGGILLGSIAAGFWLIERTRRSSFSITRALGPSLYAAFGVHTIVIGVCLGFTGYMDNFGHANPQLFEQLVHELSFCR
ncbi:MAG: hypothetical protein RL701_5755, partial [Pseudomonadota bacterium]